MTDVIAMADADYAARYSTDDGQVHDYLKRELADPAMQWLIPRCQEGALYPDRHPRVEISDGVPRQRGSSHTCRGCLVCRRRSRIEEHL